MGVLLLAHIALAQQERVDSLLQLLQRHTSDDTVKLALLTDVALAYATADPEKGLARADSALALGECLGVRRTRTLINTTPLHTWRQHLLQPQFWHMMQPPMCSMFEPHSGQAVEMCGSSVVCDFFGTPLITFGAGGSSSR